MGYSGSDYWARTSRSLNLGLSPKPGWLSRTGWLTPIRLEARVQGSNVSLETLNNVLQACKSYFVGQMK